MDENLTRPLIDRFAERVGIDYFVNIVNTEHGKIVKVFAWHFVKAHRYGVTFARGIHGVQISGLSDITISSSFPTDMGYWQGLKGLFSADLATKVGGGIIELTSCPEGLSPTNPKWIEYLQHSTRELKEIYAAGNMDDLVALGLALNVANVKERHTVCIVSDGISGKEATETGFEKFRNVDDALEHLSRLCGPESKLNILTH